MAKLPPYFNIQFFDNNGDPLSGGKVYTYDNGTTTNKTTYQDADESAANTNPIILDSAGRANIYLDEGSYTFKVDTSADVELYTVDDITGETANAFGSSVQDISSNTAITTAQQNSILVCTSSPTLSLLSSATAGQGFVFTVKNNGTGTVTIDPNASETIDGSATKTVAAGYTVLVVCDGTNWRTAFEGPTEFTGVLAINGTASAAAGISLAEDTDNGTNTVTLQAPAALAANITFTLPDTDGDANDLFNTDGSGNMSYTPFLDEDDMSSDSETAVASQQSIKAYVDNTVTPWVAYTPTFTGFGTCTGVEFYSRLVGDTLEVRGKFTSGTATATEARITLGYNGTSGNATVDSSKVPSTVSLAGDVIIDSNGPFSTYALVEPSVTYMTIGSSSTGRTAFQKIDGNLFGNTETYAVWASFPVTIA